MYIVVFYHLPFCYISFYAPYSFLALFGLMFFSFLQRGGSFSELVALIQEAALSINWSWMLDFVACCGLIVLIVWLDHKKHSSKSKHKG